MNLPKSSVGLTSSHFSGNNNTISVIINTSSLSAGIPYQFNVKILSTGGDISIPISFRVSFIWDKLFKPIVKEIKSTAILLLFIRALLFISAHIFNANDFDGFAWFGIPFWGFFALFLSIFRRSRNIGCLGVPATLTLGFFINPFIIFPIDSSFLLKLFRENLDGNRLKYEYYIYNDIVHISKILIGWTILGILLGIIWGIPNGLKNIRWIKNKDGADKICFILTAILVVTLIVIGRTLF
jgi:hypothetical protein